MVGGVQFYHNYLKGTVMVKYDETKKFLDRLHDGKLNRRSFMKGMGAAGLASVSASLIYSQTAHAYEGAARIFLWGGYDDPGLFGPYIEKHGEPEYATFGDAEEGLKKLKAGFEQDVAWPCQGEIKRWVRGGVLQPLDISRMEHWNDMFPEIRDLPSGIVNGEHYFAPVDWGDTSLTYNTEKINWMSPSQGNESLTLMEDPRLKGKLGILNSAADSLYVMMHYLGTDITKSESLTKSAIDQGINKYRELRDNGQILTFFDDTASIAEALGNEEVWAAMTWNETSWETGMPFMKPKEKTMNWVCGVALCANTPNVDKAYDLMNAATSPETSAYLLSEWGYGHSNKKGFSALTAAELDERGVASNPVEHLANGVFSVMPSDENADYMEAQWAEMVAGG